VLAGRDPLRIRVRHPDLSERRAWPHDGTVRRRLAGKATVTNSNSESGSTRHSTAQDGVSCHLTLVVPLRPGAAAVVARVLYRATARTGPSCQLPPASTTGGRGPAKRPPAKSWLSASFNGDALDLGVHQLADARLEVAQQPGGDEGGGS
jgi:hypothetical protein